MDATPVNVFFLPENVELLPGSKLIPFRMHGSEQIWSVEEEFLPEGAVLLGTPSPADIPDSGR